MWQPQHMCNVRLSITDASSSWQDKWLSEWRIDAASAFISLPLLSFSVLSLSRSSSLFSFLSLSRPLLLSFLFYSRLLISFFLSCIFVSLQFFTFFFFFILLLILIFPVPFRPLTIFCLKLSLSPSYSICFPINPQTPSGLPVVTPLFHCARFIIKHFASVSHVVRRSLIPSTQPLIIQPEKLKWNIINNPPYWNLLSAVSLSLFNKRLVTVFPI